MVLLGAENEKVNAQKILWFFGPGTDNYVALNRKEWEYTRRQVEFPTTGLGVLYYSAKIRGRFKVVLAYTTGEVGNSVPQNFDEMMTEAAATGEIPENAFRFATTDKQGTPLTKDWDITKAKIERLKVHAAGEGESVYELDFIIVDAAPNVS